MSNTTVEQPKTILAYGETLWDLFPSGPKLGGAPFNFAYRVNSLGDHGTVVTRLGRDELGARALEQIKARHVGVDQIQWDDQHLTGTVTITIGVDNALGIRIHPDVAYDYIESTQSLLDLAATADCVCFGTVAQRTNRGRQTLQRLLEKAPRALKLLDINLRKDCYSIETIAVSLACADVLKLNEPEANEIGGLFGLNGESLPALADEILNRWALSCCLITLEDRGVFAAQSDGVRCYVPGFKIDLADSLGAGDAFTAGFIHRYLRSAPLDECCRFGNILGALAASQEGATEAIDPRAIQKLMEPGTTRCRDSRLTDFLCPADA